MCSRSDLEGNPLTSSATNAAAAEVRVSSLVWWLTVFGCALFAVDDVSTLRSLGGGLLASPGWIPILVAGWIAARDSRFRRLRLSRVLGAIYSYGVLVTLLTLPFLASELLGESPINKSIKFMVSVGVWMLLLVSGAILSRLVPKAIQLGCAIALAGMTIGAILYHGGFPLVDQIDLLHSYPNFQQRVRSTRFEASSLGSGMIVCLGLIAIHSPRKLAVIGFSLGLVLIGQISESRGTTLTVFVTLLAVPFAIWMQLRKAGLATVTTRFYSSGIGVLAIILSFRLDYFLGSPLWSALGLKTEGTSDASRSMWADASLSALAQYPFGMGYAAYLAWLPKLIENSTLSAVGQFSLRDLSEMINQSRAVSDATLSPKNLVGIAAVHLGVIGVLVVVALYSAVIKNAISSASVGFGSRFVVGISLIVVSSTYYTSVFSMDQAFLFGALAWGSGQLAQEPNVAGLKVLSPAVEQRKM